LDGAPYGGTGRDGVDLRAKRLGYSNTLSFPVDAAPILRV
jgi:hypothetical protein